MAREVAEWAAPIVDTPELRKVLHAIRHRFISCCRQAGVEEQYALAIAGHAPGSQHRGYGEFAADVLRREINKLDWTKVEGRTTADPE